METKWEQARLEHAGHQVEKTDGRGKRLQRSGTGKKMVESMLDFLAWRWSQMIIVERSLCLRVV